MVSPTHAAARRLFFLLTLLLGGTLASHAQIVDDSTKVLYGPKTTRVIYEAEILRDSVSGTPIDTALTHWPQARFWTHDTTFQQDLGIMASASRPLLYQPNYQLGTRFGRNAFDRNTREGSEVPYYDSRSPYSFFRYVQGSSGEQVFEISYSRSLKKNFSIGIDYERIAGNQVLAVNTTQWQTEHNNFTVYGRYQNDDGRYHLLANYTASRQRTRELGGIWPTKDERVSALKGDSSLFKYDRERVYLSPGVNIDDRDQFHLLQTYRLLQKGFTAYHVFDARRQYNGYTDNALPRNGTLLLFYPQASSFPNTGTLRNTVATDDRALYRQIENTFGLLGRTDRIEYNVYARYRNAWFSQLTTPLGRSGAGLRLVSVGSAPADTAVAPHYFGQLFVGGTASFNYHSVYAVEVAGEYLPYDNGTVKVLGISAEYWLRGRIRTGPLSAELLLNSYSPTLTQRVFIGNNYAWSNLADRYGKEWKSTFSNTTTQQLTVRLKQRLPLLADHSIELSGSGTRIAGLVFYNQQGVPQQLSSTTNKLLLVGFARHRFRVGSVYFDNQGTYTQGGDGEGLRIPALVTESRVYYQRRVFGRALFAQVGAELYYQSSFRAYSYAPSTQQFYVQDSFTIGNYAVANAFVAADISSASIFLKVAYLNQGLGRDGYFTTPYYTGYGRRFQFGVRWRFFS
jgi:hypothetical protein